MVETGGIELERLTSELRDELDEYFGALNEVRTGTRKPEKLPRLPGAFIFYKQCKAMNTPLVEGGILDQPHIWLEQYAICQEVEETWRLLGGG